MKSIFTLLGCLLFVFQVSANNMPIDASKQSAVASASIAATPAPAEASKGKLTFKERLVAKVLEKKMAKAQRTGKADDRKTHWGNIASLAAALATFIDIFVIGTGLALVFAICAIVFGAIGMKKSGEGKDYKGKGMGIAGLIAGIVATVLMLVGLIIFISWF